MNKEENYYKVESLYDNMKELYENFLQKGKTFSPEIEKEIKAEIEKIIQEKNEWLKKNKGNE